MPPHSELRTQWVLRNCRGVSCPGPDPGEPVALSRASSFTALLPTLCHKRLRGGRPQPRHLGLLWHHSARVFGIASVSSGQPSFEGPAPPPPPVVSGSVSQSPWLLVDFGGGGGRVLGLRHLGNDIKRLSFMQHFLGPFLEHSRRLVLHSMCLGKCRSRERSLGCRWAGT